MTFPNFTIVHTVPLSVVCHAVYVSINTIKGVDKTWMTSIPLGWASANTRNIQPCVVFVRSPTAIFLSGEVPLVVADNRIGTLCAWSHFSFQIWVHI